MSTTTTFYSGVKLAPPVLSASVESVGSEQKAWYTIQVYPCDITILSSSNTGTSTGGVDNTSSRKVTASSVPASIPAKASIPRKPYKIYRRFEDIADFADQFEEEFSRLVATTATAKSASTLATVVPGLATTTTAATVTKAMAATRATSHAQDCKSITVKRSSVLNPNSLSTFGNSSHVH
ncbi:hypothetical protein BGX20_005158, partial [Mortierella sp. AD010]